MRIACRFAVVTAVCLLATQVNAAPFAGLSDTAKVENAVVVSYDPMDGLLSVDGSGVSTTTLEIKSAGSNFTPEGAIDGVFGPPFDVLEPAKLFKLDTAGFESLVFGNVVKAGLSAADLMADFDVNGSILPSGGLDTAPGGGPLLHVVPEPSSLALVFAGLLGLLGIRRK